MNVQIVKAIDFTKFGTTYKKIRKPFFAEAMSIIVSDIIAGIREQKAITGGNFPSLEPETIKKKGHDKALIDKGLLTDEWTYQQVNKFLTDTAEITIKSRNKGGDAPRDRAAEMLQLEGIKSKSGTKKFFFFGVSRDASDKIMERLDQLVVECLEAI